MLVTWTIRSKGLEVSANIFSSPSTVLATSSTRSKKSGSPGPSILFAVFHPSLLGVSGSASQLLSLILRAPLNFRLRTEALGAAPGLLAYADLVEAGLCWRAGQRDAAQEFLNRAQTLYCQADDLAWPVRRFA